MKCRVWFDSIQITKAKTSEDVYELFCSEPIILVDYGLIGKIATNLYDICRLSTTSYHKNTSQIMSREWRQTPKKMLLTEYKLFGHAKSQILICGRAFSHYFVLCLYIHLPKCFDYDFILSYTALFALLLILRLEFVVVCIHVKRRVVSRNRNTRK